MSVKPSASVTESYRQQQLAEKEARKRIEQLQENIKRTEEDLQGKLEQVKDHYEKQIASEAVKSESYLDELRGRAAEQQLTAANEIRHNAQSLQRRGEKDIHQVDEAYKEKVSDADSRGRKQLRETMEQYQQRRDYETRNQEQELSVRQAQHQLRVENSHETQASQIEKIQRDNSREIGRLQKQYQDSVEKAEKNFDSQFQQSTDKGQSTLDRIQSNAAERIQDIRADTAYKLAAYSSRQSDPFYRMLDLNVGLSEHPDSFVITATIPQHEQEHVSVNVRGNELVISGRRSNQETLNSNDGHKQQTSSYQYYMEAVPLDFPVDERGLQRAFQGDRLVIHVPKKEFTRARDVPYQSPTKNAGIEKLRAEKPQFPPNIPDYREPKKPKA